MKNKNIFEMKATAMNQIHGGDGYATLDKNGDKTDTWNDNDGDLVMSPGDTICY